LPKEFEWHINNDYMQGKSLLTCMPDPDTRYLVLWAVKNKEPIGFMVYRGHHTKSGYLGEMDFVVDVRMHDEDLIGGNFSARVVHKDIISGKDIVEPWTAMCGLFTDIEEAKELAQRDYDDNIRKKVG
jgi:hypothetical protein